MSDLEPSAFVGRERELHILERELADAARGSSRLAFLVGEPGIGKTRVALALAASAARRGCSVAWGRSHEAGSAPLYWPWIQLLGECAAGVERELRDALEDARRALRETVERSAVDESGEGARFALYDRVAQAIALAARARPAVLVLEDLHWADSGSLHLLEFVVRELVRSPVLFVATLRDGALASAPERARVLTSMMAGARTIALSGLERDAVANLLARRLDEPPEPAVVDEVLATTGGNPFLVIEVANLLGPAAGGVPIARVPLGARALLRQRLDGVSERERSLLDVASVIGVEFDLDLLARARGEDAVAVRAVLAAARERGLVRELDRALHRHAFDHALLRETLYEEIEPSERCRIHGAIVRALEEQGAAGDERVALLAHHAFEAARGGDASAALRYGTAAGEQALARLAFDDAIAHFERALAAWPYAASSQGWQILAGLGQALHATGQHARARAVFQRAVSAARAAGTRAFATAVLRVATSAAETLVQDGEVTALLEEAIALLPPDATPLRAFLLARLAWGLQIVPGARDRARLLSDEAAEIARSLDDPRALEFVLTPRLRGLLGPDDGEERRATIDEILARRSSASAELDASMTRIGDLAEEGDRAGLDAAIAAFSRKAGALRMPYFTWASARFETAIALLEGRLDAAEVLATRSLELGRRVLSRSPALEFAQQMFLLRGWQDRLEELAPSLASSFGEVSLNPAWRCAVADFCSVTGRDAQARRELDAIAASGFDAIPREGAWLMCMSLLSGVCARLDARSHAEVLYELLLPYRSRIAISRPLVVLVEPIELALAKLAATLRRYDLAEAHLDCAAKIAAAMRSPVWEAEILLRRAELARGRDGEGARALAHAWLDEAEAIADRVGMRLLVRWVSELRATLAPGASCERASRATEPRVGTFCEEGEMWTLALDGTTSHLRPMVGLSYIARLIAAPGCEVHAVELVSGVPRAPGRDRGDAGEHLDATARAQYEERIRDVLASLAEAERCNDVGRAEAARREMEQLESELARGFGLGGRARRAGSPQERARVSATRAIRYAIDKIDQHDRALAEHLRRSVRTGTFLRYEPSSRDPIRWRL